MYDKLIEFKKKKFRCENVHISNPHRISYKKNTGHISFCKDVCLHISYIHTYICIFILAVKLGLLRSHSWYFLVMLQQFIKLILKKTFNRTLSPYFRHLFHYLNRALPICVCGESPSPLPLRGGRGVVISSQNVPPASNQVFQRDQWRRIHR